MSVRISADVTENRCSLEVRVIGAPALYAEGHRMSGPSGS
jgi:hypothetical protein